MNTKIMLEKFESLAMYYVNELEKYSLKQFTEKPSEDEWSLGQMYNHLLSSAYMQLGAIKTCTTESATVDGKKTEMGEKVYGMGAFPPIQIKLPNRPGYTPNNPTNKEEIKQALLQLIEQMKEVELTLSSSPSNHKVEHPGLGYLNAVEWFQLIYMHFAHHLRQKERLEEVLPIK
ncbi:DinB family protein [Bacillus sp. DX1.1]|uniref:DinB family protein n=1 Tax=unclassified Bacillus (in: firmicutes) TaxID=185979 RepID=UPI0025707180|nr:MULTISPECIES: DinB family protein [unclassified Bacillus (in: firmicutes)]MDM5153764.1 DinB family protein [Bacillus sp. DX1.1]WJE82701.1 DinB family protein [Bacillus sp. DX3.1]